MLPTHEDVLAGWMFGEVADARPPDAAAAGSPLEALTAAVAPSVRRAPCMVAFSGGRDSALVLAVAVDVARREGLEPPVPVSLRFEHVPSTQEDEWQQLVVEHLGLDEWIRPAPGDALDLIGPLAAPGLQRHGVLFPANAHLVVPVAAQAGAGGSVLTGLGGDIVLGEWRRRALADVAARRRRPRPGDLRVLAPEALRRWRARRRGDWSLCWLEQPLRGQVVARNAAAVAGDRRRWDEHLHRVARLRAWRAADWSLRRLGADAQVEVVSPLLDDAFITVLARAGGRTGWGDRTATLRALAGDLLPERLVARRTKATFAGVFFGERTREFARSWDGTLDAAIDTDALRATWLQDDPHFGSAMLLQAAWLAVHGT